MKKEINKNRTISGRYSAQKKESHHAAEEFPAKSQIVMCPEDGFVYFKKSWHHRLENIKNLREDYVISFSLCPVSLMKKNRVYEGELVVKGLPQRFEHEFLRLVRNFGETAFSLDPLDQILHTRKEGDMYVIECSENQMVIKLARKISAAFKGRHDKKIVFSKETHDVVRANIDFT